MTVSDTEYVVLLDDDGLAVGTAKKTAVHTRHTPLHLAFSCYIFNDSGHVLMTKRAYGKPTWPGVWTNSCCGHPAPNETIVEAIHRRTWEELRLPVTDVTVVLPNFRYRSVMPNGIVENELCPVALARVSGHLDPDPDPIEVDSWKWLRWRNFLEFVEHEGVPAVSPWCVLQCDELATLNLNLNDDVPFGFGRQRQPFTHLRR